MAGERRENGIYPDNGENARDDFPAASLQMPISFPIIPHETNNLLRAIGVECDVQRPISGG